MNSWAGGRPGLHSQSPKKHRSPFRASSLPSLMRRSQAIPSFSVMNMNSPCLVLNSRQASLSRRLLLAGLLIMSVLTAVHAANTFENTGPLSIARSGHTTTLLQNGKALVTGGSTDPRCPARKSSIPPPACGVPPVRFCPRGCSTRPPCCPMGKCSSPVGSTAAIWPARRSSIRC